MLELINYLINRDHNSYDETVAELNRVINMVYDAIDAGKPKYVLEEILMGELCLTSEFLIIIIH